MALTINVLPLQINMKQKLLPFLVLILTISNLQAEQTKPPIRALLVTGGCCHDYQRQKAILTKGISARANVHWTVVHQGGSTTDTKIPLYEDPNWAEGFDVVVHNECFAHVKDQVWLERILEPHRNGTPAVLIHCAMHCYRTGTDDWFEFVGMQSPGHGPHYSYTVQNEQPDHPIMQGFGKEWTAPKGELYHSMKVWPTASALAVADRQSDMKPQVCVWTNLYRKQTRVFGTTIGHYNETMADPAYLDMVTRGLLWATNRLDEEEFQKTSEEQNAAIQELVSAPTKVEMQEKQACCGEGNLALGGVTTASSSQNGHPTNHAVDGNLKTRWCTNGSHTGSWWQVDLGKSEHVRSLRIHWEMNNTYKYKIDGSDDGESWETLVDQSSNETKKQIWGHSIDSPKTRFLRVTFLGTKTGAWGSFWEFEAYATELPELPEPQQVVTATIADVKAPDGFNVTLFGTPPQVNYPVCLTAAPTGEVFIGIDEQGSLGKEKGRGRVVRCLDRDGDGAADEVKTFAVMDHPRGLVYDNNSLWVLHPPYLTVYHDDNADGVADREERLIEGISTTEVAKRGADHTTNGIRMGIDGWIYIAVGDFGFTKAVGKDGTVLSRRGGGIVRIRPDGADMEIYNWGQRNILDACIDPYMNIFTRDNTNDGGEWNVRLSHILQSAEYGYPSLFMNFTEEIMPPLADYGGGSGCGGFYLHDLRWPEEFGDALYTCDWGRSAVYRHRLPQNGPTYDAHQEVFLQLPRPTDIDLDGSGRMYVSSWKDGKFAYDGPNVGFVTQVTPIDYVPKPFPNVSELSIDELVSMLSAPGMKHRLHAQCELLRRAEKEEIRGELQQLIQDNKRPDYGRVAAIYTLKQLLGSEANSFLMESLTDKTIREYTIRALTDHKSQLEDIAATDLIPYLNDENPRVVAATVIALGRLGDQTAAEALLPLSVSADNNPEQAHNVAHPGRVIPHLAIRSLIALQANKVCLDGLETPYREGATLALQWLHNEEVVTGLLKRLSQAKENSQRGDLLALLIRLYHREGDYQKGWWGTRPDRTGPYYDRQPWEQTKRIEAAIVESYNEANELLKDRLVNELVRHRVHPQALPKSLFEGEQSDEPTQPIVIPSIDPNNPNQIANMKYEDVLAKALAIPGTPRKGRKLFLQQSCVACHTYREGQSPKGPHLVDIGKRYKRSELIESILKPDAKIAQGFDTYSFITIEGLIHSGFVVGESAEDLQLRQANGLSQTLVKTDIEERVKRKESMMPKGIVNNLTTEELADLLAFLEQLK